MTRRQQVNEEDGFLSMGTLSPNPWDLPLSRQNGCFVLGRLVPPRHSGRWVGAPVASLRCRILRPGKVSIPSPQHKLRRKTKPRYKQCCSESVGWPVLE
jgi:hypothetical protein